MFQINSAFVSKINWTQIIALAGSFLVVFGIDVPDQTKLDAVAGIQGVQSVVTWVFRTWFTAKPA